VQRREPGGSWIRSRHFFELPPAADGGNDCGFYLSSLTASGDTASLATTVGHTLYGVSTTPGTMAFTRMPCLIVLHCQAPCNCLRANGGLQFASRGRVLRVDFIFRFVHG